MCDVDDGNEYWGLKCDCFVDVGWIDATQVDQILLGEKDFPYRMFDGPRNRDAIHARLEELGWESKRVSGEKYVFSRGRSVDLSPGAAWLVRVSCLLAIN